MNDKWKLVDFFCGIAFFVLSLDMVFNHHPVPNSQVLSAVYLMIALYLVRGGK